MTTILGILGAAALFGLFATLRARRECEGDGGGCGACDGAGCAFSKGKNHD